MCFSAEASFGIAAALVPAGGYCIRRSLQRNTSLLPVAVIPLLFAIQQIAEGFVWVGISQERRDLVTTSALVYLFFAWSFWLFWAPFCMLLVASGRVLKWCAAGAVLLGMVLGMSLYLPVVSNPDEMKVHVVHHSIQYTFPQAPILAIQPPAVRQAIYLTIIAIPLFFVRTWQLLGFTLLLIASAVISHLVFEHAFTSVWCFFAAVLSIYLCFIFRNLPASNVVLTRRADQRTSERAHVTG